MFLSTDDLFAIGVKSLGHRKDLQEEIQELRLENYRLQHFPPLSVVRTRGDGCIGHMSYEGFVNGKKPNIKQKNLNTVFANIAKTISLTSDSFLVIISQIIKLEFTLME